MNSLLIAGLAAVDVYYIHEDVILLANLAGAAEPAPVPARADHLLAVVALGCVVAAWVARRLWSRR